MMSADAIIKAAHRAKAEFDGLYGEPADNCAVLKELALDIFRAFYGMVEDAGADPDIIKTWIDGVPSDFDYAFADSIESHAEAVSAPRFTGHNVASRLERRFPLSPLAAE